MTDQTLRFGETSFSILVGPPDEEQRFSLHKDLAINKAGFFENAFRNEWKESSENTVHLPDHKPEHFQIFFLWTYSRRIYTSEPRKVSDGTTEWDSLAGAWALGAYLQAADFQDAVTDAIIETAGNDVAARHTMHETIYANSVAGAPIRKLLVDIAVWRWDSTLLEEQDNGAAWADFFRDLSIALVKARSNSTSHAAVKPNCDYHEHQRKGLPCYKTKKFG